MRLSMLLFLVLIGRLCAAEALPSDVPTWVLRGILHTETKSSYRSDGLIVYVDKRRGSAGERGPFQMTPAAFKQVAVAGERFANLEKDPIFAEYMACKYLVWLYNRHQSWKRAIEEYNAGPGHRSPGYYRKVACVSKL